LVDICMPKLCRSSSVRRYIMDNLDEVNIEEGIR
jgi:hypothetical protein